MKYILDISDDIGECKTAVVSGSEGMCFVNMTKLTAEERTGRWIPVSEGLPETDKEVFVYLWGDVPYLASMNDKGQWETDHFYLDADEAPKAWMSLPEPYKEGK